MGNRHQGRIIAFQTLYRYGVTGEDLARLLDLSWLGVEKLEKLTPEVRAFAQLIVSGTIENLTEIDAEISNSLEHWDISRVARVDLANLRISVFGLLYMADIPASVTIDEAIEIARDFGTDDSYRFINGVLDGINKTQQKKQQKP